jgi:hypothetical protein
MSLYNAQGQRATLGTGKEASFGTKATINLWHAFMTMGLKVTDAPIALTGARGNIDTAYPVAGGRTITGPVDIESTADTIVFWAAMGMGAQTTPSTTIVNTTLSATAIVGATSFTLTSGLNVFPGMILQFDTSTNLETLTIATVQGAAVTTTTAATKAHAQGAAVTCTATGAYLSKYTLAPLPSFSMEINRFGPTAGSTLLGDDFLGCKVESLAFSFAKGMCKVTPTVKAQNMVKQATPTTATLSTKNPFVFERQASPVLWNATVLGDALLTESSVISVAASLSNTLTEEWSLGNGPLIRQFLEGVRTASGSIVLGFETSSAHDAFNAAVSNGQKPSVQLTVPIQGTDFADSSTGTPFALTMVLPKIYLSSWDGGDKSTGPLRQTVAFSAHPSGNGTNDSVTLYAISTNAAVY